MLIRYVQGNYNAAATKAPCSVPNLSGKAKSFAPSAMPTLRVGYHSECKIGKEEQLQKGQALSEGCSCFGRSRESWVSVAGQEVKLVLGGSHG